MRFRLGSLLLLLSLACRDPRSATQAGRATKAVPAASKLTVSSAPGQRFEPPDQHGWGRAGGLRYLERTLAAGDPAQPLPLVIMIHGLGDAPRFDWFRAADSVRTPMRLIMPQAPTPYYGGFAWFPFRRGDNDPVLLARDIAAAADQLAHAIALLSVQRPTLGRPIVAGFSQGGMLSYALALRHPALLELSHPISGFLPEPLWPQAKATGARFPRIAAMHGDQDDLVPIAPARQLRDHLSAHGYDSSLREFAGVPHRITPAMEAYTVELLEATARALTGKP